jgi:hypothetical protein
MCCTDSKASTHRPSLYKRSLAIHEEVAKFYLDFGFVPSPAGERSRGPQRCRQWHCVGDTVVHRTARETT